MFPKKPSLKSFDQGAKEEGLCPPKLAVPKLDGRPRKLEERVLKPLELFTGRPLREDGYSGAKKEGAGEPQLPVEDEP